MSATVRLVKFATLTGLSLGGARFAASAQPSLSIQLLADQSVVLSWQPAGASWQLEGAPSLARPSIWSAVPEATEVDGDRISVRLVPASRTRFFRLIGRVASTRVESTSPASGESGVAVTREVIVRLSGPLSEDAVVTPELFHAESAGRRILSRTQVSRDRRTLTLFHLEHLPAGSRVRVTLRGSELPVSGGGTVDADGNGTDGGTLAFEFDTASITAVAGTAVVGRVLTSHPGAGGEPEPIAEATITIDGAEESLRTTTDAEGRFRLEPVPAGRFFVHVDGRTAVGSRWPDGAYYPFVGKAWEAVAGRTNNPVGGQGLIYLPLIAGDALRAVSDTESTVVGLPPSVIAEEPALAGVEVTIAANALFGDGGARGGRLGLAAVPPDRLPEPLPPGLSLPLVITVQTDGALNLDPPAPVRMPNVPDPVTGLRLEPGAKAALWSFNHDSGRWEPQGLGTVSADGAMIATDPGVGIRQPGWHGFSPGGPGHGPGNCPPHCDPEEEGEPEVEPPDEDREEGGRDPCNFEKSSTFHASLDLFQDAFMAPYQGSNPVTGCLVGAAVSTARAGRDCVSLPNPDGCGATVESAVIGTGLGCLPYVGNVLGLGWGAKGVIDNAFNWYDCTQNHDPFARQIAERPGSEIERTAAFAPVGGRAVPHDHVPPKLAAALQWIDSQLEVSRVSSNLTAAVYGSSRWSGPKSPADAERYEAFFDLLQSAVAPTGPAGSGVDAGERAALHALQPPDGVTVADVNAVIDRVQAMASGALGTDPVLRAELAEAFDAFVEVVEPLEAAGWTHLLYGLERALIELSALGGSGTSGGPRVTTALAAPGSERGLQGSHGSPDETGPKMYRFPKRPIHFRLRNQALGFEQRGRLNWLGRFTGLILAPDTPYRIDYFDPRTFRMGRAYFRSAPAGQETAVPAALMFDGFGPDFDGDGLVDAVERMLGTDPARADSDEDGASDAVEIRTGSQPLDGVALTTGLVGQVATPGAATGLTVSESVAYITLGTSGVVAFDLTQPESPTLTGRWDTPGNALAVAAQDRRVAVADGPAGLALIDWSAPSQPARIAQLELGNVEVVERSGAWAFAGTALGEIVVVDIAQAAIRHRTPRLPGTGGIDALQVRGQLLYALTGTDLYVFQMANGGLFQTRRIAMPGGPAPLETGRKLSATSSRMYVGTFVGFSILDLARPIDPVLRGAPPQTQAAIHDLAPAGSGLLVATTSFGGVQTLAVSLYDVGDPTDVTRFLTSFPTPGDPRAARMHRGLAYVADGPRGISVLNLFLPGQDQAPPAVSFAGDLAEPAPRAERGQPLFVAVEASDDTLVREVSLLVNGTVAARDGSYPFEFQLPATAFPSEATSVALEAEAVDIAGNRRRSAAVTVGLVADATPPGMASADPAPDAVVGRDLLDSIVVELTESVVSPPDDALQLWGAGPDGEPETADDVRVSLREIRTEGARWVAVPETTPLPPGRFRLILTRNITDAAGNAPRWDIPWTFEVSATKPMLRQVEPMGRLPVGQADAPRLDAVFAPVLSAARSVEVDFVLREAGTDGRLGTADDRPWEVRVNGYDPVGSRFTLQPIPPLGVGTYRLTASGAPVTTADANFDLTETTNRWISPTDGAWQTAGHWLYPIVAEDRLLISVPDHSLTTTNRGNPPILTSVVSDEAFHHASGRLSVREEARFEGPVTWGLGNTASAILDGGGRFVFRGGLRITSNVAANQAVQIADAELVQEGRALWESGDLRIAVSNSLLHNLAGATFEVGERAGNLVGATSLRLRFVNAGRVHKPAGTNFVVLGDTDFVNGGEVRVSVGGLAFHGYRGEGALHVDPGVTVALAGTVFAGPSGSLSGPGNLEWGHRVGNRLVPPNATVAADYRITGGTTIESGTVTFLRAIDLPGSRLRVGGHVRFGGSARWNTVEIVNGTEETIRFDGATEVGRLICNLGTVEGSGTIRVLEEWISDRTAFSAGGGLEVVGRAVIRRSLGLSRALHLRAGSTLEFSAEGASVSSVGAVRNQPVGRIVNEGTVTKAGPERIDLQVPIENRGLLTLADGIARLTQAFTPRLEQQLGATLRLEGGILEFHDANQLVLSAGTVSGVGVLRQFSPFVFSAVRNAAVVQPGNPAGTLRVEGADFEQRGTGELKIVLTADGYGRLEATQDLILAGRLRVDRAPGYEPAAGTSFEVAVGARRIGEFGEVILPPDDPQRRWTLKYGPAGVTVTVDVTARIHAIPLPESSKR